MIQWSVNVTPLAIDADVIMVCVGRRPYTDSLGLETCGIETNKTGQITVDDNFKVSKIVNFI